MTADTRQREVIAPKEGDVFGFAYNQAEYDKARGDLRWCFDGQLVWQGGQFIDSYWGLVRRGVDGRTFSLADAHAKGVLHYVCNLNDVEKIQGYEFELYAEGDAFNLSHQHGCYKHYVKRKGARKSADLMRAALDYKVRQARDDIERAISRLEYAVLRREQLTPRIDAGEEISI
jgi:hypothetical protein